MALPSIGSDPAVHIGLGGWLSPYDRVYKGFAFYKPDPWNHDEMLVDIYGPFSDPFQLSLSVPVEVLKTPSFSKDYDYELTAQSNPQHVVIIRRHQQPRFQWLKVCAPGPETMAWTVRRRLQNEFGAWEPMVRTDNQPMVFLTSGDLWPYYVESDYQPLYVRLTTQGEIVDRPLRRSARLAQLRGG